MTRLRWFGTVLPLLATCQAAAQGGGASLSDPFVGARTVGDDAGRPERAAQLRNSRLTADEKRAMLAADLTGKGFEAHLTTRRLAGRTFVLLRGWHAEGTGLQELVYYVFAVAPGAAESGRPVWTALAEEAFNPGSLYGGDGKRLDLGRPYDLRGCLYVTLAGRLAYAAHGVPRRRADADLPLPEAGYYAWSDAARTFRRVAPADDSLKRRCAREHSLVYE